MSTYQIAKRADTLNLVDILRQRARHQPERQAFAFLHQTSVEESRITYAELDRQARTIGAVLQRKGAESGVVGAQNIGEKCGGAEGRIAASIRVRNERVAT